MLVGDEIGQVGGRTEVSHGLFPRKGRQGIHIGKLRLRTPLDDRRDLLGIVEGPYRERNAVWGRKGKRRAALRAEAPFQDRKSTRLNSSHVKISYAVFCLKKKNKKNKSNKLIDPSA